MPATLVFLSEVFALLDACAVGHTRRLTNHYWRVALGPKIFPTLPKGKHGEHDPEIQSGQVRKMVRSLGIEQCARTSLPKIF